MGIPDRIILTLYTFLMAVFALLMIGLSVSLLPDEPLVQMISSLPGDWRFTIGGAIIFIISIRLLLAGLGVFGGTSTLILAETDHGKTLVSKRALEDYIADIAQEVYGIYRVKVVVTMEDKMDLERKGQQSYQGYLYVRIMAFGNGALSALYDKSDGFYRRQIIIRVKDKPEGRVDDRNLSEKLAKETEGIALWCLEGLIRLAANGFNFTISERTRKNQDELRRDEDSILDFLESEGYIAYAPEAMCTTKDFYDAYKLWCEDNLAKIRSETSFSKEVKELSRKFGITYLKNVPTDDKMARGYKGVYALHPLKGCPFPYR